MLGHYQDYLEAASNARKLATKHNIDVSIRTFTQLGRHSGYLVEFADRNAPFHAEIIKPGEPE